MLLNKITNRNTYLPSILLTVFLATLLGCSSQPLPNSDQIVKHVVAKQGVVVTEHPIASEVGLNILKKNGNAIDAAIAVQLALAVVYPRAGNIGGGGFMLYRTNEGEVFALDFREKAPISSHRDMYLDEKGNAIDHLSLRGDLAAGVPGTVKGLLEAHKKFGSLPIAELIRPAYELAKYGFHIGENEAERLNSHRSIFNETNPCPTPFSDTLWSHGSVLVQPVLAETLETLMTNGLNDFYHGKIASKMVAEIHERGGNITQTDLDRYTALWRKPIKIEYKNHTIYAMPLPSSGGIALGQIFNILSHQNLASKEAVETIHFKTEAFKKAYADRAVFLGDPDFVDVPVDSLLDKKVAKKLYTQINPTKAGTAIMDHTTQGKIKESYETTHFSIIDAYGNSVSLTTTLNSNYGSKVYLCSSGFFLNNEMDDFSIKPGTPNQYGLVSTEANSIESEKRMLSSMTPTIVEKDGKPLLIVGSPGGPTIITTVYHIISNIVDHDMSLIDAVAQKRFHHQWIPDTLIYETGSFTEEIINELHQKGHATKEARRIGLVNAIHITNEGIIGVADSRAECSAAGY